MAELTLAALSLSFQLFSGCIRGYQLLSEAMALPEEYQYVRVRIKTEQYRFLDWATVAGLSESDGDLVLGRAGRCMLLDILEQQHNLLHRFGRFDDRLKRLAKPLLSEVEGQDWDEAEAAEGDSDLVRFPASADLYKKALKYIRATRTIPARLRWVSCDKKSIEVLLGKITSLNDFLTELLDKNQVHQLLELQTRTHYGIMQLNSSFSQLLSIIQAGNVPPPVEVEPRTGERNDVGPIASPTTASAGALPRITSGSATIDEFIPADTQLTALAQVKALSLIIRQGDLTPNTAQSLGMANAESKAATPRLCVEDFSFLDAIPDMQAVLQDPRTEAIYYDRNSRSKGVHVWVEWKHECLARTTDAPSSTGRPDNDAYDAVKGDRLAALVTLLRHEGNTRLFRAAQCLGYLREKITVPDSRRGLVHYRYGLAFVKPVGSDPSSLPTSLASLLCRNQPREQRRPADEGDLPAVTPSLTQRMALALALVESVERLHAVNWLHKGLRSGNVLFFRNSADNAVQPQNRVTDLAGLDLGRPVISGFEYARPQDQPLWTEVSHNPAHDLYRHPEVQADAGRDLRREKTHMFKKTYDIYALGIVLLEIAFWKPIHVILDVDLDNCLLKDTITARARLLQEPRFLQAVEAHMGEIMCSAIRACLTGLESFGLAEPDEDAAPSCGLRFQEEFYLKVVQKMKAVCI